MRAWAALVAVFLGVLGGATTRSSFAFESVHITTLTAGCVTGGSLTPAFEIIHAPLPGVSLIKRSAIIQGEVGFAPRHLSLPFQARRTPLSEPLPQAQRKIRMRLRYRFVQPGPEGAGGPEHELPFVDGPDPFGFAFQIPPQDITPGVFQYQIYAHRLQWNAPDPAPPVYLSTVTIPAHVVVDTNSWVSVGVQASASQVFDGRGGRFVLPDGNPNDGQTTLDIPAGVLRQPTVITIDEVAPNNPALPQASVGSGLASFAASGLSDPVAIYRLDAQPRTSGSFLLSLLYPDFDFSSGQTGKLGTTGQPEQKATIVWWDGFKWRRLGGAVNAASNLIATRIGAFNYMAIVPAAPLTPAERRPLEKILTPNGDGVNDTAVFALGDIIQNVQIEIFDVTGHRVKTVNSAQLLSWDGRDESGQLVESGVYIYQYEVDGQRISGLIAVAK